MKHKTYPVRECGGFVWAYLGPAEEMPEFQRPPFAPGDDVQISILKISIPCNWAQIEEGQIDSAHSSSLHLSDMKRLTMGKACLAFFVDIYGVRGARRVKK